MNGMRLNLVPIRPPRAPLASPKPEPPAAARAGINDRKPQGAVHKHYTCSTCARKGKTACKGRSIPMGKLDTRVTDQLVERLFHPERLMAILASVAVRRAERAFQIDAQIAALQTEAAEAGEKLKRLHEMVEDAVADRDDVLKDRLATIKLDRDRSKLALERTRPPTVIRRPSSLRRSKDLGAPCKKISPRRNPLS